MPARRERIPGEEWPQSVIMWNQLSARIYDYLDGLTLAEVVSQKEDDREKEQGNVGFGAGFQQTAA